MVKVLCPKCPNCGAPVSTDAERCEFCGSPIIITSFASSLELPDLSKYTQAYKSALISAPANPSLNAAVGFCYMRLKMYSNALEAFRRAIDGGVMNSEWRKEGVSGEEGGYRQGGGVYQRGEDA